MSYQQIIIGSAYYIPEVNKQEQETKILESDIAPLIEKYSGDVELTSEFIWGEPVDVLLQQAKDNNANMLFLGRRGRSRLADLLLGSTANKVAHCAGIPIVLVP